MFILTTARILFFVVFMYVSSFYEKYEERIKDMSYMTTVIRTYILSLIILFPIIYFGHLTLGFPKIQNIIITLLAINTIFFFIHYISHIIPFIKNLIHSKHHTLVNLIPLDSFYLDLIDHIIYSILSVYIPLLFVENSIEYGIILAIIVIHSFYLHSDTDSEFIIPFFINAKYHTLHHKYGTGNFSIFFSHWDDYMGTRVKELSINKTTTMTLDEMNEKCAKGAKLTIINNEVIDCSTWIDIHPGGQSVITSLIGKDSTDDFKKIHGNSKTANKMIKTLKIADLSKNI
jgi:sterol desaturase/sphingolipid hydroxylase (fatty acid hydroxylase superfamily)